jgi:nicotinate dehydrogenase subunit B
MNTFPGADERVAHLALPPTLAVTPWLDRWVRFEAGQRLRVFTGKVELGQGILSALAQIAAEELEVDYHRIEVEAVDTDFSPNEGSTSGSRSIQEGGESMRQACAEVRWLMLMHASHQLEVPIEDLEVQDGVVRIRGTDRCLSYWDMAPAVDLHQLAQGQVRPKPKATHRVVGQSMPRKDLLNKLMGRGFLHDLKLPGMLHARVVRPPAVKARLIDCDTTSVMAIKGVVQVVRDGGFLAVVAEREEQAVKAWHHLSRCARWQVTPSLPDMHDLPGFLTQAAHEQEVLHAPEIEPVPATAVTACKARYTRPYVSHASIGPSCGLAWWRDGRLEVWSHSQSLHALRDEMAKLLNWPADQIVVRHGQGAGCYGHNGADDAAFDAALIARALPGCPVRVQWMREDEFAWEPQGPAMTVDLQAGVDAQGRILGWSQSIWGNRHIGRPGRRPEPGLLAAWHTGQGSAMMPPVDMALELGGGSQRNAVPYYDFPDMQVLNHAVTDVPIRVSALRALGAYLNVFAIESFMDELAQLAGQDPFEFRLRHLSDQRARAVIERAREHAQREWGWRSHSTGDGQRGIGLGFARYKNIGCYAAVLSEIELSQTVQVRRVLAVIDCGEVVNPDGVRNQIEGGIIQVISWALKEQVCFDRERITSIDWESYPILRLSETPEIEVELMARDNQPWLGVGEGVTGPTAASLANAIHHALGVRVRDLPLTPERIVQAMP